MCVSVYVRLEEDCVFYGDTSSVAGVPSSGDLLVGARLRLKAMGCPTSGMPAAWPPGCHEGSPGCVSVCVCACACTHAYINSPSLTG